MDIEKLSPVSKVVSKGRVIVKPYEVETKTSSGFVMAASQDDKMPMAGTVVKRSDDSVYKEGDVILFRRYGADEMKFTIDGKEEKIFIVEDEEIIGRQI